ncbi:MAG: ribosomal protein S18-alanine N-acetyltransferase [Nitrospirae bacterium]|uniref:ribosomal protein S18-alanine N-acetyltransferase n=1 Tax=Candidatus Magnetobacterium casense TaxID=1455061 RepID=UPI00058CC23A|nr:ribosomal protein S18-alanine N-acetyltransferase [Candidatus Magnetobacterium casensis]MBF0338094.1 ribosomal protein S18-alanine N-acetyltransferase [Nitrospirota bacterium]
MDATIRRMTTDDLSAVLRIEDRAFSSPWSRRSFVYELDSDIAICLVASRADKVIGYVCTQALFGEAYILKLAVHDKFRRQNVGTLLIGSTLEVLHGLFCEKVLLEVRRSNEPALRLYECFGFKRLSVRSGYYTDPTEDAITMVLRTNLSGHTHGCNER